jgi:hypothetical protein
MTEEAAAQEAARIIRAGEALRYRKSALKGLGFATEGGAAAYVFKRRRGRVGELIGDAIRELFPAENRVQVAVSLVLDHGLTRYRAAKLTGADLTNITRALGAGAAQRKAAQERVHALNTQVTDAHQ